MWETLFDVFSYKIFSIMEGPVCVVSTKYMMIDD